MSEIVVGGTSGDAKNELVLPDWGAIKKDVAERIKGTLLEHLGPEVWDSMVEAAWASMLKPCQVPATGEDRCDTCKKGYSKSFRCHHNLVDSPGELQTMILTEMRAQLQQEVGAWALEWRKGDQCQAMVKEQMHEVAKLAAETYQASVSAKIMEQVMLIAQSIGGGVACYCQQPPIFVQKNTSCPACGTCH